VVDSKYSPIDCGDYDYLEIACLDRYDVEISTNGELIRGIAENLAVVSGGEFLVLNIGDSSHITIRIDLIDFLRVKSQPCRFRKHVFSRGVTNLE